MPYLTQQPGHTANQQIHDLTMPPCVQKLLLVLEDDMEILRWPTTGLLDSAPSDWEVLMLYSLGGQANELYQSENATLWHTWKFEDKLFNTGAYLINRQGMKKVRGCSPGGLRIHQDMMQARSCGDRLE